MRPFQLGAFRSAVATGAPSDSGIAGGDQAISARPDVVAAADERDDYAFTANLSGASGEWRSKSVAGDCAAAG